MLGGTVQTSSARVRAYPANAPSSAHTPPWTNAETYSPTLRVEPAFFPTLTIVPERSQPRTPPSLPAMVWSTSATHKSRKTASRSIEGAREQSMDHARFQSVGFCPTVTTLIRTSSLPMAGTGCSNFTTARRTPCQCKERRCHEAASL